MRARTLSPRFFSDEDLVDLAPATRLLFAGLWCLADREGRLEDRPRRIRLDLHLGGVDVEAALVELAGCEKIRRYEVAGVRYIAVRGFAKHQHPHPKEMASVIPGPSSESPVITRQAVEGNGKPCNPTASPSEPSGTSEPSSKSPHGDSVSRRVFAVWQESTNHPQARLLPSRHRLLAKRLREGFTEDDLIDAARGIALDPWPERVNQNSFEQTFRDAAHVERFRDFYRCPPVRVSENPIDRRIREFGRGLEVIA